MSEQNGYVSVGNGHQVYYELDGNRDGPVCVFLHGGPGLGFSDSDKLFFNLNKQRLICYDQRGCGRSRYINRYEENTTAHHVADLKCLLDYLKIEKVHLIGGSWGSTLAMLFMMEYPERVKSAVLRGYFSADHKSIDYFLSGCGNKMKDAYADFIKPVPDQQKDRIAEYYLQSIMQAYDQKKLQLAKNWVRYSCHCVMSQFNERVIENMNPDQLIHKALDHALYASRYFFIPDRFIINNIDKINNIPIKIVHGIHDILCPIHHAEELEALCDNVSLVRVSAGHLASDPAISQALQEQIETLK